MSPTPRGRNAATVLAAIFVVLLGLLWLRSSDGGVPPVPPGVSIGTLPEAAPEEPADPAGLGWGEGGSGVGGAGGAARPGRAGDRVGPERVAERHRLAEARRSRERARRSRGGHADRAGGAAEDDSRDPDRENRLAPRQDPPAAALAPSAGSGTRGDAGSGAVSGEGGSGHGEASEPPGPEFALG